MSWRGSYYLLYPIILNRYNTDRILLWESLATNNQSVHNRILYFVIVILLTQKFIYRTSPEFSPSLCKILKVLEASGYPCRLLIKMKQLFFLYVRDIWERFKLFFVSNNPQSTQQRSYTIFGVFGDLQSEHT